MPKRLRVDYDCLQIGHHPQSQKTMASVSGQILSVGPLFRARNLFTASPVVGGVVRDTDCARVIVVARW
jgi:hypothetical protein